MKILLDAGMLYGDCLTVTGKTLSENLSKTKKYPAKQQIIKPLNDPIKKDSHLVVLYGNLAPEGLLGQGFHIKQQDDYLFLSDHSTV